MLGAFLKRGLGLTTFTLDTNCLIAIDEDRPEAIPVRALADAAAVGSVGVAIVAISASEKQQGGGVIQNFGDFRMRLSRLGLGHLEILPPLAYSDIMFLDWSLWSDTNSEALERSIHQILFPQIELSWQGYCRANDLDPRTIPTIGKWRNCKCDVLAIWSHIHSNRDVFVTTDSNFHSATKKQALIALGANRIELPSSAASLL
jgi:hypothetical protein